MSMYPGANRFMKRAGKESTTLENANKAASKAQPVIRNRELTGIARTDATQALTDALAAGDAAAAAAILAELGELAYNGELVATGVLDSQFQDHGIGANLLNYRDVSMVWRPYGWFKLDASTEYTNTVNIVYDTVIEHDVMQWYCGDDFSTYTAYQTVVLPTSNYAGGKPHIYSIYGRTLTGRPTDLQIRIEEYPTYADAMARTNLVNSAGSGTTSIGGNTPFRASFDFMTASGANFLIVRIRAKRNAGAAGILSTVNLYNQMLEEVVLGQTTPSKFTLPEAKRGDLPSNVLEQGALQTHIQGLVVQKNAAGGALSFTVSGGTAYVPGVNKIVSFAGGTFTLGGAGAGVRYIYLESNGDGSSATIFSSNTMPDVPYAGTARYFPGNSNRRFIGVMVVYGSSIVRFQEMDGYFVFMDDQNSRVLTTTTPLSSSSISCVGYMPPFARAADIQASLSYVSTGTTMQVGSEGTATGSGFGIFSCVVTNTSQKAKSRGMIQTPGDTLIISHAVSNQPADGSLIIMGFWYDR